MQGMAVGGVSAERTSANAVTLFPKAGFNVNELEAIVIEHLDLDGPLPIAITIVNQPRCGVLCSFAAADEARRAHSSLQQLGSSLDSGAFASQLYIKKDPEMASGVGGGRSPGRRPALDVSKVDEFIMPQPKSRASLNPNRICYGSSQGTGAAAAAAAAAAAEPAPPAPPAPAEPAGSSQLARLGCQRTERSPISTCANRPSSCNRDHETGAEPRRRVDERGSSSGRPHITAVERGSSSGRPHITAVERGSSSSRPHTTTPERGGGSSRHHTTTPERGGSSSRHHAPRSRRELRREVEAGLRRVTPHACKCHVPARRQNGKEQPRSGLDEMYIMQQAGHACGVTKVAELRFPQLLCDSLAGARILRGVAALLHMEFCKPTERYVVERLKQCYQGIFSRSLRRALVDDCCAHAARRHADVSKRNIEAYLGEVVHRLVVRR